MTNQTNHLMTGDMIGTFHNLKGDKVSYFQCFISCMARSLAAAIREKNKAPPNPRVRNQIIPFYMC